MPKFSPSEKRILAVLIAASALFAIDRLAVAPLSETWRRLDRQIEKAQTDMDHRKRLLAESAQIRKEFAAYAGWRQDSPGRDRSGPMTSLLREIEKAAQESRMKISDIQPQSIQGHSAKTEAVFISVESAWAPLVRFLDEIQRSPQGLEIEKAEIHRKGEEDPLLVGQFVIGLPRANDLPS